MMLKAIVKGITWRMFAAVDTALVVGATMFWKTGTVGPEVFAIVGGVVGMEMLTKTGLYAMHERLWEIRVLKRLFAAT
jgi:hypothetical protein